MDLINILSAVLGFIAGYIVDNAIIILWIIFFHTHK